MEPSRPPFSFAASSSIRIMEPPLLQESEQPQPCPPSAANSLRPIPSEGRRLVEPPLPSMDAVEEETMNVEQQVAPTDEHQTVQTTPEGEGCVQLPQISKKRLRKEEKANNLEEKRRKKQQEKRRKLEDKRRHNKEKEKKLRQKKNKDGTSPSAMHCSKEVRSPICRSPGVNMIRALKRRNSAALGKGFNKSSRSHILDETPETRANSLSPRSAVYQDDVPTANLAAKPRKLRSKAWVDFDPIYEKGCIEDLSYIYCPSLEEWRKAAAVCNLLKGFYEATNILSGSSYPTSHLFFSQMWNIKLLLQKEASNPYDFVREMVDAMRTKFTKYWDECLISLCIPVIFDPRFKLDYIVFRMEKLLGAVRAQKVIVVVEDTIISLFKDYSTKMGGMLSGTTQEEDDSPDMGMEDDPMADWDLHLSVEEQEAKNELDRYLKEDKFPRNVPFDILQWWDINSAKYPIMSCIARDVLAVQASTVSSESAFSTGGRVISDYRSRLAPDTVEELICLQSWLKSENPDYQTDNDANYGI